MILQTVYKRLTAFGLIAGLMFSGLLMAISQGAPLHKAAEPSLEHRVLAVQQQEQEDLSPFWIAIPSEDGSQIKFVALNVDNLGDDTVDIHYQPAITDDFDPSSYIWSHTAVYSTTTQGTGYFTTAAVPPAVNLTGEVTMTVNAALVTNNMELNRYHISSSTNVPIDFETSEGSFEVSIPNEDTFDSDETYLTLMVNDFRPGDFPAGSRPITKFYSLRASSSDLTTGKPIILAIDYNSILLDGADPFMLGIFRWDPNAGAWIEVESTLFADRRFLSLATTQLGTYSIFVASRWYDNFDDLKGISADFENITLNREDQLLLQSNAIEGYVISRVITPTTLGTWGTVTFNSILEGDGASLIVDILNSETGETIVAGVSSGADLSDIDPNDYPSLQLKASLSRTDISQTVSLDDWRISWSIEDTPDATSTPDPIDPTSRTEFIYLPLIQK